LATCSRRCILASEDQSSFNWLRNRDLNTKFFHAAATSRKKVNRISSLIDATNNRVTQESDLCNVAKDYFLELFQAQNSNVAPVIGVIAESITGEHNVKLTSPFLIEEFKEAIFSMKPDKCSGPDGFNPGFFQKFWPLCSEEIFKQCCGWLQSGVLPPTINMINIALIPKGETQVSMKDWCPIALCNVVYKIVAKVLANRLQGVLNKCISDNQSAFVPGRSILDNAMAAIELVHSMKSKVSCNKGDVALKLDISKAYDRIY
jgi:hypothetical protein